MQRPPVVVRRGDNMPVEGDIQRAEQVGGNRQELVGGSR